MIVERIFGFAMTLSVPFVIVIGGMLMFEKPESAETPRETVSIVERRNKAR